MTALRSWARQFRNLVTRKPPAILVILPVYNVEEYLQDCLDSLFAQDFRDFVVVAVNDGSTDGSLAILQRAAKSERRLIVINQRNRGLGGARNRALNLWRSRPAARPPFVTFVDSDDILPRGAFRFLHESLTSSGSDVAVGSIKRFVQTGDKPWQPQWIARAHSAKRSGISLSDFPLALLDIIACNRMVDRAFWDATIGTFPEGVVYEDHVPMLTLYTRARKFDLLTDITYLWRKREDGSSLAQQKQQLQNLLDRTGAKVAGLQEVERLGDPHITAAYAQRVLSLDIFGFMMEGDLTDDAYWHALRALALPFAAAAEEDPSFWDDINSRHATAAWLLLHDRREELVTFAATETPRVEVTTTPGGQTVLATAIDTHGAQPPLNVRQLTDRQSNAIVRIIDAEGSDGKLILTLRARVRDLDPAVLTNVQLVTGDAAPHPADVTRIADDQWLVTLTRVGAQTDLQARVTVLDDWHATTGIKVGAKLLAKIKDANAATGVDVAVDNDQVRAIYPV